MVVLPKKPYIHASREAKGKAKKEEARMPEVGKVPVGVDNVHGAPLLQQQLHT